jgi:hypothetical protein
VDDGCDEADPQAAKDKAKAKAKAREGNDAVVPAEALMSAREA